MAAAAPRFLRLRAPLGAGELELARRFHTELCIPAFPAAGELEPFEEWASMLGAGKPSGADDKSDEESINDSNFVGSKDLSAAGLSTSEPYDVRFQMVLAITGEVEILAGCTFELYARAGVGQLSYLVTAPQHQRQGLGRALVREAVVTLGGLLGPQHSSLMLLEAHRGDYAGADADTMEPKARLRMYQGMGFRGVPGLPYVAPAVSEDAENVEGLVLLVHQQSEGVSPGKVAAWLTEYWAACYSRDLQPLADMLAYCSGFDADGAGELLSVPAGEC